MPIIRFTVKALEALQCPPQSQFIEYWDQMKPGFGLRLNRGGRKSYTVRYKVRNSGEQDRETLGLFGCMDLADARALAGEFLNAAQLGMNLKAQRKLLLNAKEKQKIEQEKTIAWLVEIFLNDPEIKKKKSFYEIKRILEKEVLQFWAKPGYGWANRHVGTILKSDVRELLDKTLERTQKERNGKTGKGVHANRVFSIIRRLFNYGIEKDLITVSPCIGLKRPLKNEESRDNVLSVSQLTVLQDTLDLYLNKCQIKESETRAQTRKIVVAILKLMLLTAQRGGEVRAIAWNDIDFTRGVWSIPKEKTKNGKSNIIPLSRQAIKVFEEFRFVKNKSQWVFPSPKCNKNHVENIQKAIQRLRAESGVACVGHDFRRTAASHMAESNVPPHVIERILNHSDQKNIAQVYNRYAYEPEKRKALQDWADRLDYIATKHFESQIGTSDVHAKV
jgi:integrase